MKTAQNEIPEPVKKIIKEVCDYFNQDYIMVMSKRRFSDLVKARTFAMYFIKNEGNNIMQTANVFDMDHSTVIIALRRLEDEVKVNRLLRNQFFELKDKVEQLFLKQEEDDIDIEANDIINDVLGEVKKSTIEPIEE